MLGEVARGEVGSLHASPAPDSEMTQKQAIWPASGFVKISDPSWLGLNPGDLSGSGGFPSTGFTRRKPCAWFTPVRAGRTAADDDLGALKHMTATAEQPVSPEWEQARAAWGKRA